MPTTRFCSLIGVPERTWRRHQARARAGRGPKGPWPRPSQDRAREAARRHALAHPAWGHRKVWANVPPRRPARLDRHGAAAAPRGGAAIGGELPAGPPTARRATEGGVRGRADRTEPGVAAGLLASSRPPSAARGGWPAAGTTGASTSWAGTSPQRRTSTTRSPRSSSPAQKLPRWPAARCRSWLYATPTATCRPLCTRGPP